MEEYQYQYETTTSVNWGVVTVFLIVVLAISIFLIVTYWKIFTKAGRPGWAAIIPFYNAYVFLKISGKPGWWLILLFIPIVNIVFNVLVLNGLSKSFGKDSGFTVGLVFLGIVFLPILAFGSSRYLGPGGPDGGYYGGYGPQGGYPQHA